MITRLIALAVTLGLAVTAHASVWFSSIPSSAQSGSSYYVEASAYGGSYDLTIYKGGGYFAGGTYSPVGAYTTDYSTGQVNYMAELYDWYTMDYDYAYASVTITPANAPPTIDWTQSPTSASVNQTITIQAKGTDGDGNLTNVRIWCNDSPFAFAGGGNGYEEYSTQNFSSGSPGSVYFMAEAMDGDGASSGFIYLTVSIYNDAPTIVWINNPASAYVNQWFNVQARGNDANGNLSWVYVWKDGSPFAFNGGGNGYEGYSDNNAAVGTVPGTISFAAQSGDGAGAASAMIYHNVTIVNRAPDSVFLSSGGVTQISLGQSVMLAGTLHDPDGNLAYHNLYYLNGANWVGLLPGTPSDATNSSITTSFIPTSVGSWLFRCDGHDNYEWSGSGSGGATLTVIVVDGTPPTVPTNLVASNNTTGNSFTLSWSASTDNVGVVHYEVLRDATSLGMVTGTSINLTGLADAHTYEMKVQAFDAAGNPSDWSSILTVTTPDKSPPSVPTNLVASSNTTGHSFTLGWSASTDNVGVVNYEVMRDATSLGTVTLTSKDITGLNEATTYEIKVRAYDAAGIPSDWSTVLIVTTPDVTAPSPPGGLTAPDVGNTSFTLTWSAATDNVGVTAYEVARDGSSIGESAGLSRVVAGLIPGTTYMMKVRAKDAAGNPSDWSTELAVTTTSNPTTDSDLDGYNDVLELQLGTDPNSNQVQSDITNRTLLNIQTPTP